MPWPPVQTPQPAPAIPQTLQPYFLERRAAEIAAQVAATPRMNWIRSETNGPGALSPSQTSVTACTARATTAALKAKRRASGINPALDMAVTLYRLPRQRKGTLVFLLPVCTSTFVRPNRSFSVRAVHSFHHVFGIARPGNRFGRDRSFDFPDFTCGQVDGCCCGIFL